MIKEFLVVNGTFLLILFILIYSGRELAKVIVDDAIEEKDEK